MKWVIVTGFLVTLIRFGGGKVPPKAVVDSQADTQTPQEVECLAGSEWESNCHFCHCTESGVAQCLKQETCLERIYADPIHCRPNTTFWRDCNTCICLDTGKPLCTVIYCVKSGSVKLEKDSNSEDEVEELGPPVSIPKSKAAKKHVNENDPSVLFHNLVKRSVCKPNQDFQLECNACKCSPDGRSYTCTQNECLEKDMTKEVEVFMESEGVDHIERHSVCKPQDTFYIGCNTCDCNFDGTDYSCTNKPCPLPDDVELFHELKITKSSKNNTKEVICAANRMFIKDCNTCWCNDDGTSFFCTRKVCVPNLPDEPNIEEEKPEVFDDKLGSRPVQNRQELRIIQRKCRPDEVFELDCNMCRCNPDGKSFSCTRRACVDQEDAKNLTTLSRRVRATPSEKLKVCTPREEFRLDCNTCLCDDEGSSFSCTRIDCYKNNGGGRKKRGASDLQKITLKCAAGSVFERDCNTCRCTDDGEYAMCTNKNCQPATKAPESEKGTSDSDVHNPESDPGFRCNPGEQFKRDCKDCTCSADGKSYFCTLRLCDEFIVPGI